MGEKSFLLTKKDEIPKYTFFSFSVKIASFSKMDMILV